MTLAVAFLGGLVSCLSPCVLPVIPVFVAHIARPATVGASLAAAPPAASSQARALGFLVGFAGVFVAILVSIGLVGFALLQAVPDLRVAAGLAIAALGVAVVLGWQPRIAAGRFGGAGSLADRSSSGRAWRSAGRRASARRSARSLTMAAASDTVWSGAPLLVAYALGMSLPFIVLGLGVERFEPLSRGLRRHGRAIQVGSGAMIVGVGVLVATNAFARLAGLVPWAF